MKERTFHRRFAPAQLCGIIVFALLMFYFFWQKTIVPAVLLMAIVICMIDRMLHTEYRFENHDGVGMLVVDHGRFSVSKAVRVSDITRCSKINRLFGLSRFLLLEYGSKGSVLMVEPNDEDAFIKEIEKWQHEVG